MALLGAATSTTSRQTAPGSRLPRWLAAQRVLDIAPVIVIALYGAVWIAVHASQGRGYTHTLFQSLALAENTVALLLRRRKPVGAVVGILAVYALVDLDPTTLLPVLLALLTVAMTRERRAVATATIATAVVVVAMPYLHGDPVSFIGRGLPHLAAVGFAATLGSYLRARQQTARLRPRRAPRPLD
jgi:membrane-bound metal-dependent hydrolase YbcI (DUF457 family)